jgi:hypothetical protein
MSRGEGRSFSAALFFPPRLRVKSVPFPFRNTALFPIGNAVPLDDGAWCG